MQRVVTTEYQDIFRITDGALLVINKFKKEQSALKRLSCGGWSELIKRNKKNFKKVHPQCQDTLKIVEFGFTDKKTGLFFKKGTVFYQDIPTYLVSQNEWDYQIKTSGTDFSGNPDEMEKMLSEILFLIRTGKMQDN